MRDLEGISKRKTTTMKKLMIASAAVAFAAVAQAGIAVQTTNCVKSVSSGCPDVVFKVTGSGKALDTASKNYTTVSKLKVNGWLVLFPTDLGGGSCCYPTYSLYVNATIGKNTTGLIFAGAGVESVDAWTLFGKKLDDAELYTWESAGLEKKKSKKFKLESQLGISADAIGQYNDAAGNSYGGKSASAYAGTLLYADDVAANEQPGVSFIATAFGNAAWQVNNQKGCSKCDKPTYEGYEITPGSYSGWFAGFYYEPGIDEECMTCTCSDVAVFGGTWKAKYQTKVASWQAAAANLFGTGTAAQMAANDID